MPHEDRPVYRDPLDLLRRFVPTPLKARYRVGSLPVIVETNDFSLLPTFPLETDSENAGAPTLEWKLIRDADAQDAVESPKILKTPSLTLIEMGPSCLIGIDHERRELLGFIGANVDAGTYREFILPLLCQVTRNEFSTDGLATSLAWKEKGILDQSEA